MRVVSLRVREFEAVAREILGRGKTLRFRACGMSMHPFIQHDDLLEVAPLDKREDFYIGDVVLFRDHDKGMLAHRIVRRRKNNDRLTVQLKGDAFHTPDGWFNWEQILGVVIAIERNGEILHLHTHRERLRWRLWRCWSWLYRQGIRTRRLVSRVRQVSAERSA